MTFFRCFLLFLLVDRLMSRLQFEETEGFGHKNTLNSFDYFFYFFKYEENYESKEMYRTMLEKNIHFYLKILN
jgi:hypothetical protein